jgi:hypothetical protein
MTYELRIHFGDHKLAVGSNDRATLELKCRELTTEGLPREWVDVRDDEMKRTYTVNAGNISYVEIVDAGAAH